MILPLQIEEDIGLGVVKPVSVRGLFFACQLKSLCTGYTLSLKGVVTSGLKILDCDQGSGRRSKRAEPL